MDNEEIGRLLCEIRDTRRVVAGPLRRLSVR
jgi:hypothetical protein